MTKTLLERFLIENYPGGKRPRGMFGIKWLDVVQKDLDIIGEIRSGIGYIGMGSSIDGRIINYIYFFWLSVKASTSMVIS